MKSKISFLLSNYNETKWLISLKCIFIGILVGLLVVFYRVGIEMGADTAVQLYKSLRTHNIYILPCLILMFLIGIFIGYIMKREPMATGSGIPQTEGIVLYGLKMKSHTVLFVRFIGGILCSCLGLSLGREGPSIQIGAAGGQLVAKSISRNKLENKYLITGGAAAGLSAAFNAPLSGIVFALEEVHRSFSPIILIAATSASLTADFISKTFFGLKPVLMFTTIQQLPISLYIYLIPIGLISGCIGALLNKSLLLFQTMYSKIPIIIRPCIALLIALPCGLFIPDILGGGQNLIKLSETSTTGISLLMVLLMTKVIFTSTSFGSGVPGGIFLPILSVGALSGSVMGIIVSRFGMPVQYIPDFTVCAMAGVLSGCVKAPVTSILLTAEMAGSFIHMLPVAACTFIALFISDILKIVPIYEALLERYVKCNGKYDSIDIKGDIHEYPVEVGSQSSGKLISQINLPQNTLIVGIRRGNKEIVPKGNTKIYTGDYLIILSSQEEDEEVRKNMESICFFSC